MEYLTRDDVLGRIDEEDLDVITGRDDDLLIPQEIDAIGEVSSYLDFEYDVRAIFQPLVNGESVIHQTIRRMTIDVMLYNLHNSRVNPRQIPENIVQKRDDAIKWLQDVADIKSRTSAPFLPKKTFDKVQKNNHMTWGSQAKNSHKY